MIFDELSMMQAYKIMKSNTAIVLSDIDPTTELILKTMLDTHTTEEIIKIFGSVGHLIYCIDLFIHGEYRIEGFDTPKKTPLKKHCEKVLSIVEN